MSFKLYDFLKGVKVLLLCLFAFMANAQTTAIVYTDKDDYQPGDVVEIRGEGWMAGETVRIDIDHSSVTHGNSVLYATADENGLFFNDDFVIQQSHLGESFNLSALGLTSGFKAHGRFRHRNKNLPA
jgi:hypothetical protein